MKIKAREKRKILRWVRAYRGVALPHLRHGTSGSGYTVNNRDSSHDLVEHVFAC